MLGRHAKTGLFGRWSIWPDSQDYINQSWSNRGVRLLLPGPLLHDTTICSDSRSRSSACGRTRRTRCLPPAPYKRLASAPTCCWPGMDTASSYRHIDSQRTFTRNLQLLHIPGCPESPRSLAHRYARLPRCPVSNPFEDPRWLAACPYY
jgi:hypothetical protein